MGSDDRLLRFIVKRLIGPAFLIGGSIIGAYILYAHVGPAVQTAVSERRYSDELGFYTVCAVVPAVLAYLGFKMMKLEPTENDPQG